jgi:hypothetical protein
VFEYDLSLPIDSEELSTVTKDCYTVRDVSYLSPYGGEVSAYLVVPSIKGTFPAVFLCYQRYFIGSGTEPKQRFGCLLFSATVRSCTYKIKQMHHNCGILLH